MAAGRICTGFSKPYAARVTETSTSYKCSNGRLIGRGVSVSIEPESSDDDGFSADNGQAETGKTTFTGGTLTLVIDGLKRENMTFLTSGVTNAGTWTLYGDYGTDDRYVAVGFIARYQTENEEVYVPIVLPKCKFDPISTSAETQEDSISWQTQELTAKIYRQISTSVHSWKFVGTDCATEAAAEALVKRRLGIT